MIAEGDILDLGSLDAAMPEGIDQMLHGKKPKGAKPKGMRFYLDRGLGGVVCNVAFQEYMMTSINIVLMPSWFLGWPWKTSIYAMLILEMPLVLVRC